MSAPQVSRWIRGFQKHGDALAMELELPSSWTLERLQALCGVSTRDPMFDSCPLTPNQARLLSDTIDDAAIEAFDFFLEADAEPTVGADGADPQA